MTAFWFYLWQRFHEWRGVYELQLHMSAGRFWRFKKARIRAWPHGPETRA